MWMGVGLVYMTAARTKTRGQTDRARAHVVEVCAHVVEVCRVFAALGRAYTLSTEKITLTL